MIGGKMPEHGKIFVHNSGLVLLAPFLPQFFQRLELCDRAGAFNSTADQASAVLVLQRLLYPAAAALCEPGEQYLALNKLLCGWPLERKLHARKTWRECPEWPALKLEIYCLLRAAINQWGEPADIGEESLMQLFLRRKGELHINGGARLQVERSPLDLLLRTLPWTLDCLQTPWMKEVLEVDWLD